MKNSQSQKKLQIILLVLVGLLTLGIGYASITAVNLIINGNATASVAQENFKVYFTTSNMKSGTGTTSINENDDTIAYFNITGLSKAGDTAVAEYTILNDSNAVGAEISLELTNSNPEYFKVTEKIEDNLLQAGDSTTATITVEMIKTPIDTEETTSISGKLISTPKENAEASGGEEKEVYNPKTDYYTISNYYNMTYIGQSIYVPSYESFEDAIEAYEYPTAIAHNLKDGIIRESFVEFKYQGNIYFLKGGINERTLSSWPVYDSNEAIVKGIFGDDYMTYCNMTNSYGKEIKCIKDNITISYRGDGYVYFKDNTINKGCFIRSDGGGYCNHPLD